ncbi:MAG: hypothetical protein CL908_27000 [Deltaproteobacteria bacterium]|nr:hypothetical protein [Deltaproteobacteria bacterium]
MHGRTFLLGRLVSHGLTRLPAAASVAAREIGSRRHPPDSGSRWSNRKPGPERTLDASTHGLQNKETAVRPSLTLLIFLILATPALATDGVLEINQTCAVNTGCFDGDTPGFPVTITTPGTSYRLTSRLIVPNQSTDGIRVSTSDIGIDLNNFAIIRSGCEGLTTDCTPTWGSGSGIERNDNQATDRGTSVKNGSIIGMGQYGVLLGEQAEVTNLRIRWTRQHGISVAEGSRVIGNTVYQSSLYGIWAYNGSTVLGNTVYLNGGDGIHVGEGSTVSDNTAYQNGGDGIHTSFGSTVSDNTAYRNGDDGIYTGSGSTISDNTAYRNEGDGIHADFGATVNGNTLNFNESMQLRLSGAASYYGNTLISPDSASLIQAVGVNGGANVCYISDTATQSRCPVPPP